MSSPKPPSGFPTQQLSILTICRLCEPIAFTSIFPYFYYMVASFHVTRNDNEIAMYTGLGVSAFAFAEFLTGMWWGRLSDKIGRKPVLLGGLAGTGLSSLMFGFATNLPMAIAARALGGLLNGNIGVIQTTVAELVPQREHQPRAYSLMPFIWSVGSIIGPAMGGLLAEPVKHYPSLFKSGGLFERFPFLLPNIVCAVLTTFGVLIGLLFLDETHELMREKRDIGRDCGRWLQAEFQRLVSQTPSADTVSVKRSKLVAASSTSPTPLNDEETPLLSSASSTSTLSTLDESSQDTQPAAPIFAWKPLVIHNIVSYGLIAYHSMSFDQLIPVFLQTPRPPADSPTHLPFIFSGGFALSTQTTGLILSVQGIFAMTFQFLLFPMLASHFGVLKLFRFACLMWPLVYILAPYVSFISPDSGFLLPVLYAMLLVKVVLGCSAYPCNAILLTNAAPSLLVLGTINGAAASLASICRAVGPMVSGVLFSWGLQAGSVGLAFWAVAVVGVVGAAQSLFIHEGVHEGIGEGHGEVVGEDAVREIEAGVVISARRGSDGGVQVVGNSNTL